MRFGVHGWRCTDLAFDMPLYADTGQLVFTKTFKTGVLWEGWRSGFLRVEGVLPESNLKYWVEC